MAEMSRTPLVAVAALWLGMAVPPARADVIDTFAATGTFVDGSVLGGTLTIDLTTGRITASDLITTGPSSFTFVNVVNQSNTQVPGDYNVGDRNAASTEDFDFDLPDPAQTPLFGYSGGSICSDTAQCLNDTRGAALFDLTTSRSGSTLVSGSLTLVPEPANLVLLCISLLGLGLTTARRQKAG